MQAQKTNTTAGSAGWGAVVLLAGVLAVLFWRSFLPEYVHFSNDGPLGQQNTAAAQLPAAFHGTWSDANDIGSTGGAWPMSISALFRMCVGAIGYSKFLVPFALFILGLGAWCFFRQLKLSPLAAMLGALAAALNSTFFATACWGVAPQEIAIGMDYFALALVVSITEETPLTIQLAKLALAGLALGVNVMEAADIGAIFSIFVAGYIVIHALSRAKTGTGTGSDVVAKLARGVMQVAVVAVFAGFIACQTVVSLVGTQITGVVGTGQDRESKAQHWDWATQWSLPKAETLGLFIPGLYGYKMDTPNNMDPNFLPDYIGGNYWGGMGRDASYDRYWASGSQGPAPQGMLRQTSGTNYTGVLVVLIGLWTATQAFRKQGSVFDLTQRRRLWFWTGAVIFCIMFAWGRFSFFYALLYQLPYFSTIRSPTKFLIVFSWAMAVLFAYGVDVLSRRWLVPEGRTATNSIGQVRSWWTTVKGFDRSWAIGCGAAVAASLLGWLIYSGEKPALIHYLIATGFPGDGPDALAPHIAAFSIHQVGVFVQLLAIATGLLVLIWAGVFNGRRATLGGALLGLFLVFDMGRANLPYIDHWDYKLKYDIDSDHPGQSTNPILNFLMDHPYEHRVAGLPWQMPQGFETWEQLYTIEWVQHQFPYYNIQTLDLFQRPRVSADIMAYEEAISPRSPAQLLRRWQLTNTRYLLGPAGFLDVLNTQLDPGKARFHIVKQFSVAPKPGILQPSRLEEITGLPDPNGQLAVFEFSGALPRAKLYSNWQVNTNDAAVLKTLGAPEFDPEQTVLVSTPVPDLAPTATNANTGIVEITMYTPSTIALATKATTPTVLLFNSKYDRDWSATVDGQPAPLLRCNFIMRGVSLSPGSHKIMFKYYLPVKMLYITLAAYTTAVLLAFYLIFVAHKKLATKPAI